MSTKKTSKSEFYEQCQKEITKKIGNKTLNEKMDFLCQLFKAKIPYYFWVGFYFPQDEHLELGSSKGPSACFQIPYTGVCGKVAKTGKPIIVPDIKQFPGHIACDLGASQKLSCLFLASMRMWSQFSMWTAMNREASTRLTRNG